MKNLNDVVQTLTGVRLSALQQNDTITLDVARNVIIIKTAKLDSQSFEVTKKNMIDLLKNAEVKEPDRLAPAIVSIILQVVGIVVAIVGIVISNEKKCTTSKTTKTINRTTTYIDGRVESETYTEEEEETVCEDLPNPTPTPTPTPTPSVPECCAICGEQLVPGQTHHCR